MAYNMIYQDRTLTDKEVSDIHNRIQQELQASFGARNYARSRISMLDEECDYND